MVAVTSSIPDVLDSLVAILTAAAVPGGELADVAVSDGPYVSDEPAGDVLAVGLADDDDREGVEGDQSFAGLPGRQRDEEYVITLTAESWTGTTNDVKARRRRAFNIMAAVERLIRPGAGPGVTGRWTGAPDALLWAHIAGGISVAQIADNDGTTVAVTFHVTCRARLAMI